MPHPSTDPAKVDFFGLTPPQFDEMLAGWGWPAYRGRQVRQWAYEKLAADASELTNLPKADRELLRQRVAWGMGQIVTHQVSSDGTHKLLLTWPDGASAETVMIPDADRRTACVSSQVGCPVGCRFCASGINGVKGNLTAGQIVEQVWAINRGMAGGSGFRFRVQSRGTKGRRDEGTKGRRGRTSNIELVLLPTAYRPLLIFPRVPIA